MKISKPSNEQLMIVLAILLLGAWIGLKLFAPKVENSTTIEEKTTIDTVINHVDVTFTEKATKRRPLRPKKVTPKTEESPEPEKYDSVRTYSGTHTFQYGKFDWKMNTGGILESYEFNPQFEIPTITIEKEKTITQTRTIIQKGVFVGGGMNTKGNFHAGATYLGNKFLIEYNFVPQKVQTIQYGGVHQVGFKYKIF